MFFKVLNKSVYDICNSTDIDIPSFQRGYVWKDVKQQAFIDTLMRGGYIPQVHVGPSNKGITYWRVYDGQQRLITLRRFINNEISWSNHEDTLASDLYDKYFASVDPVPRRLYFKDLDEVTKNNILRMEINYVFYDKMSYEDECRLFYILNNGQDLNTFQKYAMGNPRVIEYLYAPIHKEHDDLIRSIYSDAAIANGNFDEHIVGAAALWFAYQKTQTLPSISLTARYIFEPTHTVFCDSDDPLTVKQYLSDMFVFRNRIIERLTQLQDLIESGIIKNKFNRNSKYIVSYSIFLAEIYNLSQQDFQNLVVELKNTKIGDMVDDSDHYSGRNVFTALYNIVNDKFDLLGIEV